MKYNMGVQILSSEYIYITMLIISPNEVFGDIMVLASLRVCP